MHLLDFLHETEPIARRQAQNMSWSLGKAAPFVDTDDLVQEAILKLIVLHKNNGIDFNTEEKVWKTYCGKKIWGWMWNYKKLHRGHGEKVVSEGSQGVKGDEEPPGIENIAFRYTGKEFDGENEMQARRFLLEAIGEYLDSLSDIDRFIFNSSCVDEKSFEDIGRVLGFSRETARRRCNHLLEGLKSFHEARGWTQTEITELS